MNEQKEKWVVFWAIENTNDLGIRKPIVCWRSGFESQAHANAWAKENESKEINNFAYHRSDIGPRFEIFSARIGIINGSEQREIVPGPAGGWDDFEKLRENVKIENDPNLPEVSAIIFDNETGNIATNSPL